MAKAKQIKFERREKSTNKILAVLIVCTIVISLAGAMIALLGFQEPGAGPVSTAKVNVYVSKDPSRDGARVTVNVISKSP